MNNYQGISSMTAVGRAAKIFVCAGIGGTILFRLLNSWSYGLFVVGAVIGATIGFVVTMPKVKNESDRTDPSDVDGSAESMSKGELRMLYGELGLDTTASDEEVKTAYREMAKRYHPDFYEDAEANVREAAAERFRRVGEAYALIKYLRGMK